ncbi:MAG: hypothetical protein HZA58_02525 [Acidimicrobiia bacterium]|nr:hypothetical protein [Acidimicrobiia bacterium]
MDISGDPEPLLAAAIVAALTRLDEEAVAAAAQPPGRPVPGRWVESGRSRPVTPVTTVRRVHAGEQPVSPHGDEPTP